jgi:hypothetical protein
MMKLSGVNTYSKKTYLCCEHVDRYSKYKQLRTTLLKLKSGELVLKDAKELEASKLLS